MRLELKLNKYKIVRDFPKETLLCYVFVFCHYHALIVLLQNKHTKLAENGENSISTQPRISAHSQGPTIG